jgi:transcriptional regulator with XRE-family HTH domain
MTFGEYLRDLRETHNKSDKEFSLRKVAQRIGIEPSYLSKIERDIEKSPSEDLIIRIAKEFNQDQNVLLAMSGKVSQELQAIILKNPIVFEQLLHSLKDSPEGAILRLVREVRDGNW